MLEIAVIFVALQMPVHKQVLMPLQGLTGFVCAITPVVIVKPNGSQSRQWMAELRPAYSDGRKWKYAYLHRKKYDRAARDCNMFHRRLKKWKP